MPPSRPSARCHYSQIHTCTRYSLHIRSVLNHSPCHLHRRDPNRCTILLHAIPSTPLPCLTGMANLESVQIGQQPGQHRPGALQGGFLLLHNRLAAAALLDLVPDADGSMPRCFCGQNPAQQGPGCLGLLGHLLHISAGRCRLLGLAALVQ